MGTKLKIAAAAAAVIALASGGTAVATSHPAHATPHVTYRLDNAACNALAEGYRPTQIATWLQRQYGAGPYAAEAITVHAVDRGCGR